LLADTSSAASSTNNSHEPSANLHTPTITDQGLAHSRAQAGHAIPTVKTNASDDLKAAVDMLTSTADVLRISKVVPPGLDSLACDTNSLGDLATMEIDVAVGGLSIYKPLRSCREMPHGKLPLLLRNLTIVL
jgi:hypothetical protein